MCAPAFVLSSAVCCLSSLITEVVLDTLHSGCGLQDIRFLWISHFCAVECKLELVV